MIFFEILNRFLDIIESYEIIEFQEEDFISRLRVKVRLIDASYLWIREVRKKNKIIAYSYYWMDNDNRILTGWDNAPHHKEIRTFPHHKHIGNSIEPSEQKSLKDVLEYIRLLLTTS